MNLAALFLFLAGQLLAATSVTQFGITWTFNTNYTVGQYANGDYYVVAPSGLTITDISPASTSSSGRIKNGSTVNPASDASTLDQGFDNAMYGDASTYKASLNQARPSGSDLSAGNPLVISPPASLVSTISNATADAHPQLTDAAILTVVASAPSAGAFRPPPYGTDKSGSWNKNNLDYTILRSLPTVTGAPVLADVEALFLRPWLEYGPHSLADRMTASNNGPNYGREVSYDVGDAILSLHLNYTNNQKETLYIRLVQYGIDIYGACARSNGTWLDRGGVLNGRKLPLLLAGLALNDSNILAYADAQQHFIFSEDRQTFYVQLSDVDRELSPDSGNPHVPYVASDVGLPEAGNQHTTSPQYDGRNWTDLTYRDTIGSSHAGIALGAMLLAGGKAAWNWPAFFAYADRYVPNQITAGGGTLAPFTVNMWATYRGKNVRPAARGRF